jgi:hypothetical protein
LNPPKAQFHADEITVALDLDHIQDLRVDEAGFKDLVLPTGHQNMVLSMVNMHTVGSRSAVGKAKAHHDIDIVRGKGLNRRSPPITST